MTRKLTKMYLAHQPNKHTYLQWIGMNCRSLTYNYKLYTNMFMEENHPDIIILCETWLVRESNLITKNIKISGPLVQHTKLYKSQMKKGILRKPFVSNETFLIAVELIYRQIFVIGIYKEEDIKDWIFNRN